MKRYDVVVIGAGVSGCAIARELSRKKRSIAVLDKNLDVCEGTSKANSGIVHAGHDAMPGTLKAMLNVWGNELMEEKAKELDFPFRRNGSLILCFSEQDEDKLEELKQRGEKNGVKGLEILSREQVLLKEPNVSKKVVAALWAPTGGIVCPFGMTIAYAENAAVNGVDFYLNTEVKNIKRKEETINPFYIIETDGEEIEAKLIINAAGVYADAIHNMVSKRKLHITPRRGQYCLMDKNYGKLVESTIFQLPTKFGKGVLVTPTVHGNLLVGPSAEDIEDKEDISTTADGIEQILERASISVSDVNSRMVITSFSGLRAHLDNVEISDFIIEENKESMGFFDVAGIESPGLTCAPAIGIYVADMVNEKYPAQDREDFVAVRKGIPNMALASDAEKERLIAENPAYANVICRCELVTEGEIVDAILRPVGATTLDGVKRRTRAGMGRCQSGFCAPKVLEILAQNLKRDRGEIMKSGPGSNILEGHIKDCNSNNSMPGGQI